MTEHNHILAVYGTLKSGHSNHSLLQGAVPLGKAKTVSTHTLVDWMCYPAVVLEGNTQIVCETYRVNDEIFHKVDLLESYPNFYNRKQVEMDNGLTAWIYFIPSSNIDLANEKIVDSGEWS